MVMEKKRSLIFEFHGLMRCELDRLMQSGENQNLNIQNRQQAMQQLQNILQHCTAIYDQLTTIVP